MKTKINFKRGLQIEPKVYKVFFGEDMYTLSRDPILAEEAATKNYVSIVSEHLNVENLTGNTFTSNLFCSGLDSINSDVVRSIDNVFVYKNGTNTSGAYKPKVTVNIKGIVTGTSDLIASDVPNLSWGKFEGSAPTSLAGYGITDGVKTSGDFTITGNVKLSGHPSTNNGVASKYYVDQATLPDESTISTMTFTYDTSTPGGYLRCNGAQVLISEHVVLYSMIGTTFNTGGETGGYFRLPDYTSYTLNTGINVYIKA